MLLDLLNVSYDAYDVVGTLVPSPSPQPTETPRDVSGSILLIGGLVLFIAGCVAYLWKRGARFE